MGYKLMSSVFTPCYMWCSYENKMMVSVIYPRLVLVRNNGPVNCFVFGLSMLFLCVCLWRSVLYYRHCNQCVSLSTS